MNLYELLKDFWLLDEQKNFSGNETRLYFFLIYLANRSFWQEWIEFADKKMIANVGTSLQVLKSSREKLKEAGLIDFVAGGGYRVKTKYRILILKPASKSAPNSYNIKDKNNNTYGKRKGFIHSGSDFD